jgi:hypothetical protein
MAFIHFDVMSMADAEEAIAETWRFLEQYDIPSPDMTFAFRGRSRVKITLRFDDPADAETMMLHLFPLGEVAGQWRAVPPKMQPTRVLLSGVASSDLRGSRYDRRRPNSPLRLS